VTVRAFAESAIPITAHFTGLSRALAIRYSGRGIIFMLHSVVEDSAICLDEALRCPVGKLEWILRWLKKQGIEFVSLDEAVDRLSAPPGRPFAVFTFDDGYADNLIHALPVMERLLVPFTVYVTTAMVTREIDAWWLGLAALIRSQERFQLPGLGRFECSDLMAKKRTYVAVATAIHKKYDLLPQLQAIIKQSKIDCRALVDQEALTEKQLRQLARHPLVTVGAHTTSHRNLAEASAAEVHAEMQLNRKFLQETIGTTVMHFAYPFGNARACEKREAEISRSLGFRTAVTTRHGAIFAEHLLHLHALPREPLSCHDSGSTLRCKIDGLYRAYHSRLGDPVAHM
jgi:peptidoglycan/xylan/chitin deacetylase (PgdA/CDA1 family)